MNSKSYLFVREPHWTEHRRGLQRALPEAVLSWVYEPGSLTQRLREYYGTSVNVAVLSLNWQKPYLSESRHLTLSSHRFALIREVLLHAEGKPLLLARTAIPQRTITVAHRNLAHLGSRPLGEVIFSYPDLARVTMDIAMIEPPCWSSIIQDKATITGPVWGRRTVYEIHHRPMLISEFFLDEILAR